MSIHYSTGKIQIYKPLSEISLAMATPICAGDFTTVTPAPSRAVILSLAVPLPPEMIAPACPIRLPGGAVSPAQYIGFESAIIRRKMQANISCQTCNQLC